MYFDTWAREGTETAPNAFFTWPRHCACCILYGRFFCPFKVETNLSIFYTKIRYGWSTTNKWCPRCLEHPQVLRPGLVKGQWSAEEDVVLMKLATSGYKNWGVLSNHMPGETRACPIIRLSDCDHFALQRTIIECFVYLQIALLLVLLSSLVSSVWGPIAVKIGCSVFAALQKI